jgi:hypothetical protein
MNGFPNHNAGASAIGERGFGSASYQVRYVFSTVR